MSCYFPLHAYKAKQKESDKISITFSRPQSWRGQPLNLPCGQCTGCRLERSRQWAIRCMHEASLHEQNSFLTLTYDDQNLPRNNSLHLGDYQLFIKRLRKFLEPKKVRYYHCGEYGEQNERPHYHALLFGHDFDDKKKFSKKGENYVYTSDTLSGLWEKGFAVVGSVTFESAAYVARYIMKKVTGEMAENHYGQRIPEYTTMSRRPGIGTGWFKSFQSDVYPLDRVITRGHPSRPPRFYDNLLGKSDRSTLELIKIKRENEAHHFVTDTLDNGRKVRVSDFSAPRLLVKNIVKEAEIQQLKRSL
ncbi:MAG: replication initiator protein [Microvirus sp.]|nr:MAG: replication initiator protein [Microvirus sp.]